MSNSSQESAAYPSPQDVRASTSGCSANGIPTVNGSLPDTGPASRSSRTSEISQATLFETPAQDRLPSSREGSRASRSQVLASVRDAMTTVSSGRSSAASFASRNPDGSWEKTSADFSLFQTGECSVPFLETWPTWGTCSGGAATALTRPVARPTDGTGCSLSGGWGTPRTSDAMGGERPTAINANGRLVRIGSDGETAHGINVSDQAINWHTPDSVPDAPNTGSNSVNVTPGLGNRATAWQTPDVAMATGGHLSRGGARSDELLLPGQAQNWPTPRAAELDGRGNAGRKPGTGGRMLDETARSLSLPAPTTSTDGDTSSPSGPTSPPPSQERKRLNPEFVLWLMNFPEGWLDL